jgi:cytochrome c oxidase subunit 4
MAQAAFKSTEHADQHHGGDQAHEDHGTGAYWMVFILLMVLLLATVGAAYINLGHFNVPLAYAIASIKATLILWYFMHLKQSTRLTQVFAFASFAWLALMLIMTFGDYIGREMILPKAEVYTHLRKVHSYPVQSGIARAKVGSTGEEADLRAAGKGGGGSGKMTDHKN